MRAVNWEALFYGSQNYGLTSNFTMLGTSMTILMGVYSNDRSDVALVADRRSSPVGSEIRDPNEDAFKTLRLGTDCAIGFAGAVPLGNYVLAKLFGVPCPPQYQCLLEDLVGEEHSYSFGFHDVKDALNVIVPAVIAYCQPPKSQTLYIILAGRFQGRIPVLAGVSAGTEWKVEPYFDHVWSRPKEMSSFEDQQQFHDTINAPGMDYGDRMLAAIEFCSKYQSVNNRYIIRRLSMDFTQEPGIV
jgi:hypothetical protein